VVLGVMVFLHHHLIRPLMQLSFILNSKKISKSGMLPSLGWQKMTCLICLRVTIKEGTNLIASVQDDFNEALDKRQSESHYHHVDLQYTVSGIEGFGIIEHETSKPSCKYKPDVIHYFYNVDKARFYNSSVSKFFLFFPEDWHIAKVITNKKNQKFRVIVIKLDYVE